MKQACEKKLQQTISGRKPLPYTGISRFCAKFACGPHSEKMRAGNGRGPHTMRAKQRRPMPPRARRWVQCSLLVLIGSVLAHKSATQRLTFLSANLLFDKRFGRSFLYVVSMLSTASCFTNAPTYGLLSQLFGSSIKSKIEQSNRIASAVGYLSTAFNALDAGAATGAGFLSMFEAIASNPPIFTVYELKGPDGATFNVVSPEAPLFNMVA